MSEIEVDLSTQLSGEHYVIRRDLVMDMRFEISAATSAGESTAALFKVAGGFHSFTEQIWTIQTLPGLPLLEIRWPGFVWWLPEQLVLYTSDEQAAGSITRAGSSWTLTNLSREEVATARRRGTPLGLRRALNELPLALGAVPLPFSYEFARDRVAVGSFRRLARVRHTYRLDISAEIAGFDRLLALALGVALAQLEQGH